MSDNPPAFPLPAMSIGDTYSYPSQPGMTLRDWFAGQCLASAAALPFGQADYTSRAFVAYKMADAMLLAREQSHV